MEIIDLNGKLEVFFITNGRSTAPYAQHSLDEQLGVKFKMTVHKDMDWLEANRRILDVCKSRFFLRVDDDMILNGHAISYMWLCLEKQSSITALRGWKLWEPYSNKVVKGIKAYDFELAKKIVFRISNIGKIDKLFTQDAEKTDYRVRYGNDVVGVHACSNYDEHLRYALMRGEQKGKDFKAEKRWMKKVITGYDESLEKQKKLTGRFLYRVNKKHRTGFYRFIKEIKAEE